ncbi:transcription antiterminator BlgG [Paracoccus sp. J56]|uniref:transcription antiterminator BlgG n=1 Tax=Paracoccus sp. J56 TaxID=935850 RepID=UPI000A0C34B9|nr:transcription antiterminator BlgG [Paracoccus sp. J56]SMG10334.1 sulfate adenylyltransferase [Paracoccus sp. J56]
MTLPHHQPIRELLVSAEAGRKLLDETARLAIWDLTVDQLADLRLLVNGGYAPLRGFLPQADHQAVLEQMRLASGALWPVPVPLDISAEFAAEIDAGEDIALRAPDGTILAIMSITDKWAPDWRAEAEELFGGCDPSHPGVVRMAALAGRVCLGGPVKGLPVPDAVAGGPNAMRSDWREQGRARVLACDPGDEALARPVAQALDATLLTLPAPRHHGPREALRLAILARNYGATDLLLPADEAAQDLLRAHQDEIGVTLARRDSADVLSG